MFNKKTFFALAVVAGVGVMSSGVMAVAANDTISVAVAADSSIAITTASMTALSDPKLNASTGVAIMKLTINNNNEFGFGVVIDSTNAENDFDTNGVTALGDAVLKLDTVGTTTTTITEAGRFLAYTIQLVSVSGTAGGTITNDFSATKAITKVDSENEFAISTPTQATNDLIYNIEFTSALNDALFEGTFTDTFTVTMTDEGS